MPVEDLNVGDLVETRDHGPQPIRYIARSEVSGPKIPENRQPVLITCGSLGASLPKRDLVISSQHRMLLAWREVRKLHEVAEVFAPAKGIVALPGVRVKRGVQHVQYIHLLLEWHEVIFAYGAPAESFYPGPTMLRDMSKNDRQALFHAVSEQSDGVEAGVGEPARKLLRVQETKKLVRKHRNRLKDEITKWDVDLAMERYEAGRLAASGSQAAAFDRAVARTRDHPC